MAIPEEKFAAERPQLILARLRERGRVVASELARDFGVSEDAIRRDLRDLASKGLCKRVYGGAVLPMPTVAPIGERSKTDLAAKGRLAAAACSILDPGQIIFIDAGSTNLVIASTLPQRLQLSVVTNSPQVAMAASAREGVDVQLVGGRYSETIGAAVGAEAILQIQRVRADVCFLGACAIDALTGVWAMDYEEATLKRSLIAASSRLVIAATPEKLGARGAYHVGVSQDVDDLIVDSTSSPDLIETYRQAGITVHVCGK